MNVGAVVHGHPDEREIRAGCGCPQCGVERRCGFIRDHDGGPAAFGCGLIGAGEHGAYVADAVRCIHGAESDELRLPPRTPRIR